MARKAVALIGMKGPDKLSEWRARVALTTREAGALFGVSGTTISMWETAGFRPSPQAQLVLTKVCLIPLGDWLTTRERHMARSEVRRIRFQLEELAA